MTKAIVEIAKPLGIAVHDHIIVGKNGHAKLKGDLDQYLSLKQASTHVGRQKQNFQL